MNGSEDRDRKSEIDLALERLLVGELRVKVDPTTGQVITTPDGEKSSLTDPEDPHTIA